MFSSYDIGTRYEISQTPEMFHCVINFQNAKKKDKTKENLLPTLSITKVNKYIAGALLT